MTIKLLKCSVQNKQSKKDTFQQPQILAFSCFFKLIFFPEENPTRKLANSLGPRRNSQNNQSAFTYFYFLTGNSQKFETKYKMTVIDKTLLSSIPKIQAIPLQNEGDLVFSNKCSQ